MIRTLTVLMLAVAGSFAAFVDLLVAAPLPAPRGVEIVTVYRKDLRRYESDWTILPYSLLLPKEAELLLARIKPQVCPPELHGVKVGIYLNDNTVILWLEPAATTVQKERLCELVKEIRCRLTGDDR